MIRLLGGKACGAFLVLAGSGIYFAELADCRRHWTVIPAVVMIGIGAVLTMFGAMGSDA